MRSYFASIQSITVPAGGGPPNITIGPASVLPASLIAYYLANGATVVAGQVNRISATDYTYAVLITDLSGLPMYAFGGTLFGTVGEAFRLISGVTNFGHITPGGSVLFENNLVDIVTANSVLRVLTGAAFTMTGAGIATLNGTGGTFIQTDRASLRNKTYTALSAVGFRNVNTFAAMPNTPAVTLTKLGSATETNLIAQWTHTCFGGVNAIARIGVDAGLGTAEGGRLFFNVAATHLQVAGTSVLTNLAAGSVTATMTWAAGAGTIQTDANDWASLHVREVPV